MTTAGVNRAITWIGRNTAGPVLAVVEATRSYGATITSALTGQNTEVAEVKPPRRQARAGVGKNDEIDATAAVMSVLGQDVARLLQPRSDGVRAAISILLTSRQRIDTHRTMNRNALNTLAREFDLGIDARTALTNRQIVEIAGWRTRATDTVAQRYARAEAVLLAPRSVTVGAILVACSHHGQIRAEDAFASLAGAAPSQTSSGNTVRHRLNRHRLNRHGDRRLNQALDVIARVRMRCNGETKLYVELRTAEGKTYREIKRFLKRYRAGRIFRQLQVLMA